MRRFTEYWVLVRFVFDNKLLFTRNQHLFIDVFGMELKQYNVSKITIMLSIYCVFYYTTMVITINVIEIINMQHFNFEFCQI